MKPIGRGAPCRILLIGPLPPQVKSAAIPIGGGAVSFAEMVRELRNRHFDIEVVDSSRPRTYTSRHKVFQRDMAAFLKIVWRVMKGLRRSQLVIFCTSAGRAWVAAAGIWAMCGIARRPLVVRFFGGDFAQLYDAYRSLQRWWSEKTYLKCALLFVQTEAIFNRFSDRDNFRWFPNTRNIQFGVKRPRERPEKLLFLSRLNMEKGLRESVEACRDLPDNCHLNVFGPIMPDTDVSLLQTNREVSYCGVLHSEEVPEILAGHDVLLFPSYWASEGYPGVVLESLQCGTPVIGTRWAGIPEIVEHERSGLLVEPRSAAAVRAAVERLISEPRLYQRLCEGARSRGDRFRSALWYDRMAKELRLLVGRV